MRGGCYSRLSVTGRCFPFHISHGIERVADEFGCSSIEGLRCMPLQPPHISETEQEYRKEKIRRDVIGPGRYWVDGDKQNGQKCEGSHPWNYCVPPKAEVLGKFALDVRGQCE